MVGTAKTARTQTVAGNDSSGKLERFRVGVCPGTRGGEPVSEVVIARPPATAAATRYGCR